MAKEIERKFLLADFSILAGRNGLPIMQGYLAKEAMTVRVRTLGEAAYITVKGPKSGLVRDEFEYPIPFADARAMLQTYCSPWLVHKTRYRIPHGRHLFEVDIFAGKLAGLAIAEVELQSESEPVELPPWVGREITADRRFGNFSLARMEAPPALSPAPLRQGRRPSPRCNKGSQELGVCR